ncbi:hypothetical protein ACQPVP_05080 [Clostridium nigeriense]|uniref:hypothetical protein n=1 Tax=Clostridium nigeriense TaxID=1805470 RepID=UPI003D328AAE
MERISSNLFMLALLIYYIPKLFKIKKFNFIKAHIVIGSLSVLAMCIALIQKIGQADFIKYIGFTSIMVAIGVTGYFSIRKRGLVRKIHIASTIGFFGYLFTVVAIL